MNSKRAGADERVQFTLRLDPELHAKLVKNAGMIPLNAFIAGALEFFLSEAGPAAIARLEIAEDAAQKKLLDAERKLKRAEELFQFQPKSIAEAFEAGRDSALSEFKVLIRETIADSIEEAFERRSAELTMHNSLRKGGF